ncbi:MAG: MBL fold metallo-hydrolase [Alphaproteobacteria bacterium]
MRVTMLGCGHSGGVPLIGCDCAVCTSKNPKNTRKRVSVLVEVNNINILIDTSPDLHQQALDNGINRVDAVLYTHDHADHTHGIDELRSFNYLSSKEIPVFSDKKTLDVLQQRFAYAFKEKPEYVWFRPSLTPQLVNEEDVVDFEVMGVSVTAFKQGHGKLESLGFRIGDFAYSTDVDFIPEKSFEALVGVKVWIVDCLRETKSHSHSYLEQTLTWIERVKPSRAVLTHMSHEVEYEALKTQLPPHIEPGYDGLTMDI